MEKTKRIIYTDWSPKVRYDCTSSCHLRLENDPKNVKYEVAVNDISKSLNVVIDGSTVAITPDRDTKPNCYITVYARLFGKIIAKEIIPIEIRNKKRVGIGWGLGLGLATTITAGAVAWALIRTFPNNGSSEVDIGKYVVKNPVNCTITEQDGRLVIKVIDPTIEASVNVTYQGDPAAVFNTDSQTFTFKDTNTLVIPANTASTTGVDVNISAEGKGDSLPAKVKTEEKPGPTPTTDIELQNPTAVPGTGIEVNSSTNKITFTKNGNNGQFTLTATDQIVTNGLIWTIKVNNNVDTSITATLGSDNKTVTIEIPKDHADVEGTLTISCVGATATVKPWSGTLSVVKPTQSITLSNPIAVPSTNVSVDSGVITFTKGDMDGKFTLDLSGTLTTQGAWIVKVNSSDTGITATLTESQKLTVTIPETHDTIETGTITIANNTSAPAVNTWTGTLTVKSAPVPTTIDLENPTKITDSITIMDDTTISYAKDGKDGKFSLTASSPIIASGAEGLQWTVALDSATTQNINVSLEADNVTLIVTISSAIKNVMNKPLKISCTGATATVNDWSATLTALPAPVKPVTLSTPTSSSTNVAITKSEETDVVTFTKNDSNGTFTLTASEEVTDGSWAALIDGEESPKINVSISGTTVTIIIPADQATTEDAELSIVCTGSSKTVSSWTCKFVVKQAETEVTLSNPVSISSEVSVADDVITYTKDADSEGKFTLDLSAPLSNEGNWVIQLGDTVEEDSNAITASASGTTLTVTIPKTHGNVVKRLISITNIGSSPAVVGWTGYLIIEDKPIEGAATLSTLGNAANGVELDTTNNIITYTKSASGDKDGEFTLNVDKKLTTEGTWTISVSGVEESGTYAINVSKYSSSNNRITVKIPTGHDIVPGQTITISNTGSSPAVNSWSGTLFIQNNAPTEGEVTLSNPLSVTTDSVVVGGTKENPIIAYTENKNSGGQFTLDLDKPLATEGKWVIRVNGITEGSDGITAALTADQLLTVTIPNTHSAVASQKITITNTTASQTVNAWNATLIVIASGITLENPTLVSGKVNIGPNNTIGYTKVTDTPGVFTLTANDDIVAAGGSQLTWTVKVGEDEDKSIGIALAGDQRTVTVTIPDTHALVDENTTFTISCVGAENEVNEWVGKLTIVNKGNNQILVVTGDPIDVADDVDPSVFCTTESTISGIPTTEGGTTSVEKTNIQDVTLESIKSGVTEIPDNFLSNCTNMSDIDLTGLSDVTTIGDNFLYCCTSLTSTAKNPIDLSGLTNVTTIGEGFLSGNDTGSVNMHLQTLDLTPMSNVTSIGNEFLFRNADLVSVDLTSMTEVTEFGEHFLARCTSLESVDLSAFSKVQSIGRSFCSHNKALKSLDMSAFTSVTWIGHYFCGDCSGLESINISGFINVETLDYYFLSECTSLQSLDMSMMTALQYIGHTFMQECDALANLYAPDIDPSTITYGTTSSKTNFMSNTKSDCNIWVRSDLLTKYTETDPWSGRSTYIQAKS